MAGVITIKDGQRMVRLLDDIFTDDFMQANTNFENFDQFKFSSAVFLNWNAETLVYPELLLTNFVKESTRFSDFDEMVISATDLRYGPAKEEVKK